MSCQTLHTTGHMLSGFAAIVLSHRMCFYVCNDTHLSSSIFMPGSGETSDPVAMMKFFALTVVVPPSSSATSSSFAPANLPQPFHVLHLQHCHSHPSW